MSRGATPLLEVSGLAVTYGGVEAVSGATLHLDRGQALAIAGPSGSGKTSLALAILGALPPGAVMHGSVRFHGRAMAPVFQEPSGALHPLLTAGAQVAEAARAHGFRGAAGRERVRAALDAVGLGDPRFHRAYPHQLSGGERQRVLIAQALASNSDLIVADEPTSSLDLVTQAAIAALLHRLQHEFGLALLIISHRTAWLRPLAGAVRWMEAGRLAP